MLNKIFFLLLFLISLQVVSFSQQTPGARIVTQQFIYDTASFPSCHASTITETPVGLITAWFGGTHEKHKDVEIWVSRKQGDVWTTPTSAANGIQDDSIRYPCWNPVLFQYPKGPLMLFYKVGPNPIEWWGELKTSNDHGKTWSKAFRLPQGILGPVKNKPVLLNDGRLICPSSTEDKDGRWQVHLETTKDTGKTWTSTGPLNDGLKYHIIQPSLLLYQGRQQLLCRSQENRIVSLWSTDGARSWSTPDTTSLVNPNSGTDAVTLKEGWQVLVYNPTEKTKNNWGGPRSPLHVAMSKDGIKWKDVLVLESEPGEYSYPAVIQSNDNVVHITYTWNRKKIKWVSMRLIGGPLP
jgi:predicted neuraminidase